MRKLLLLFLILFSFPLFADSFDQYHLSFEFNDQWVLLEDEGRSHFYQLKEHIGTLNVRVVLFPEPVTANAFQQMRMTHYFDGWVHKYEREGTAYEKLSANVDDMYLAIYSKHDVNQQLQVQERLTIEYYFIKSDIGYLLSYDVPKLLWPVVESDFKFFLTQFWIGPEKRDQFSYSLEPVTEEWGMDGKDGRHSFFMNVEVPIQLGLTQQWALDLPSQNRDIRPSFVFMGDHVGVASFDQISVLDTEIGAVQWTYHFDHIVPSSLTYAHDLLFFISGGDSRFLTALMRDSGALIYQFPLGAVGSSPVYSHQQLFMYDDDQLRVLDYDTGQLAWSKSFKGDKFVGKPVVEKQYLVVVYGRTLFVYHSVTGTLLWKKELLGDALMTPLIVDGSVIVCLARPSVDQREMISFFSFELETSQRRWVFQEPNFFYDVVGHVTADYERVYFSKQVQQDGKLFYFLMSLDVKTGKFLWKQSFSPKNDVPFQQKLSRSLVFLEDFDEEHLLSMDVLTGDKVPFYYQLDSELSAGRIQDLYLQEKVVYFLLDDSEQGFSFVQFR